MSAPPPSGYYPEQPYYAPGWQTPAGAPPPQRRGPGRPLLLALVVVLAVAVLAAAVVGVLTVRDTRPLGEVDGPVSATSRQLDVGHCIAELPEDGPVGRLRVVPCGDPHEAEVVGAVEVRGSSWPGQAQVERDVTRACTLDDAWLAEGFRPVVWSPSQASWQQGDRLGLCLARAGGGTVTGSLTDGGDGSPA